MAAASRNSNGELEQPTGAGASPRPTSFADLLKQSFKPRSERAASEVENAVQTLVTQALADSSLVKGDVHRHDRGDDRARSTRSCRRR